MHQKKEEEEDEVGKRGGGGFDGLLSVLRDTQSPNLRRKALSDFFDAVLPETLKQLPTYIHHIYILLDPISTITLLSLLTHALSLTPQDTDVHEALTTALTYLTTKHDCLASLQSNLPSLLEKSSDISPAGPEKQLTTRRHRLRQLRAEWRRTRAPPRTLVRKVRFAPTEGVGTEKWYLADEGTGGRRGSEGKEEWFVAKEEQDGGELERGKSVRGLLREGMRRRQEKRLVGEDVVEGE